MTLDASADEQAILQRLKTRLWNGRVYDEIPDEQRLERDENGLIKPYIIMTFGTLFPSASDRSIEGAQQQPYVLPFVGESWGATLAQARAGGYGIIQSLTGFKPSENASEIELSGGGGGFTKYDQGRPVRFLRPVSGMCIVNMSIDDALD